MRVAVGKVIGPWSGNRQQQITLNVSATPTWKTFHRQINVCEEFFLHSCYSFFFYTFYANLRLKKQRKKHEHSYRAYSVFVRKLFDPRNEFFVSKHAKVESSRSTRCPIHSALCSLVMLVGRVLASKSLSKSLQQASTTCRGGRCVYCVPGGAFAWIAMLPNEKHIDDVTKFRNVLIVGVDNVLEIPSFK